MNTIYITQKQVELLKEAMTKDRSLLTESRADKALKKYIREYTNSWFAQYMDVPLRELPPEFKSILNPSDEECEMYRRVADNQTGNNTFFDYLRINFYEQFGISHNNGPKKYMEGIARIALKELGFYGTMQTKKIIKFGKIMRDISSNPEILEKNGIVLDGDLNGLSYDELMELLSGPVKEFQENMRETLDSDVFETNNGYTIHKIEDVAVGGGTKMFEPTRESFMYMLSLEPYADWCILGNRHQGMYGQYTSNGGRFYICEKEGFKDIKKEPGDNCPLDEYGLSLICVLVGEDGWPENITTRWNHDYGGENHKDLCNARQLQNILGVKYFDVFKPRNEEELSAVNIREEKKKNKYVNSGILDNIAKAECSLFEDANPENDEYKIGFEKGGPSNYGHVTEDSEKENESKEDEKLLKKYFDEISEFMSKNGLNVKPFPKTNLNWDKQDGLFIRTGFYSPDEKSITLFCKDRHPKDILRSFAHEMIHHSQNLDGKNLNFSSNDDVKDNKELEKLESEAYLKGNIYFRKWTEYKQSEKKSLNENMSLQEAEIFEDTNPDDIDLSSFNIKKELNPKFWKNDLLDSRIRLKLLDIADDFIDFLGVDWVKPSDIVITGSLANYNWNKKYSDIDLHVLIDFSKVDKRTDFVKKYFDSLKSQWNETHENLKIFGFPVEVYVQDVNEKHTSTGVYSIDKNKWVTEPERNKLTSSKVNKTTIRNKVAKYVDEIDKLEDDYKNANNDEYKIRKISEKAEKLFDEIKNERRNSLGGSKKSTEITTGNIIFKCLRRLKYLDKLYDLKTKTYDKMNSLP